jgi:alkylated DNA repair dioxygenase AlkB
MKDFNLESFHVIKKAIPKDIAEFVCKCLQMKKEAFQYLKKNKYLTPSDMSWGLYDSQVKDAYSHYAFIPNEVILKMLKPIIEKKLNIKLVETYSFCRVYLKGDELVRHKDRASCAISATLNLGGDLWPIYIAKDKKCGIDKGIEIKLNQGDLLIYNGVDFEHWRKPFTGEVCYQTFLHYNLKGSQNKYDKRELLGLPTYARKN